MASNTAETLIGAAVLAVAAAFMAYATNTADIGGGGGYEVVASFRKAEGISVGSDVRIAGVKIGSVSSMTLDPQTYNAILRFSLNSGVQIPEDSDAKITSAGILGDSYIAIEPGAEEYMLADGEEILQTQGSISLTDLLGRFVQGAGLE